MMTMKNIIRYLQIIFVNMIVKSAYAYTDPLICSMEPGTYLERFIYIFKNQGELSNCNLGTIGNFFARPIFFNPLIIITFIIIIAILAMLNKFERFKWLVVTLSLIIFITGIEFLFIIILGYF